MWHLVCGDVAVEGVTSVLGQGLAEASLRVLRDDLAVGPLRDAEEGVLELRGDEGKGYAGLQVRLD